MQYFTISDSRLPQPGGPRPCIYYISPRNRVAQLYPQALGSLFVASYVSQGYGGNIQPHLHTGPQLIALTVLVITPIHEQSRKHRFQQ
jgi:hypothetical protein